MDNCAFDRDGFCVALKEKQCDGCKFRKTEQEVYDSRMKAAHRLDSLPKRLKIHIARKYYNTEWREDG